MNSARRRRLRQIAHHLHPIVTVAGKGLDEGVVAEAERALTDHELIKVRVSVGERDERVALLEELARLTGSESVQRIGRIGVLYRENPEARHSVVQASGA